MSANESPRVRGPKRGRAEEYRKWQQQETARKMTPLFDNATDVYELTQTMFNQRIGERGGAGGGAEEVVVQRLNNTSGC